MISPRGHRPAVRWHSTGPTVRVSERLLAHCVLVQARLHATPERPLLRKLVQRLDGLEPLHDVDADDALCLLQILKLIPPAHTGDEFLARVRAVQGLNEVTWSSWRVTVRPHLMAVALLAQILLRVPEDVLLVRKIATHLNTGEQLRDQAIDDALRILEVLELVPPARDDREVALRVDQVQVRLRGVLA